MKYYVSRWECLTYGRVIAHWQPVVAHIQTARLRKWHVDDPHTYTTRIGHMHAYVHLLPPHAVLIVDFDCRPLPVQISWKSPSLHEVRAEEHEPALMLRQDAISVFWRRQTRQKPLTLTLTVHCFLLTTHVGNGCGSLRLHLLLDSFGSILHSLSQCLTVHCHLNLKVSQSNNNTRSNN